MRSNPLKTAIANGRPVVNAWCSIGSPYVAEIIAHQGFDSVTIDLQHGAIGYEAAFSMLQAISTSTAVPCVRVPWNEPALLMKLLDAGAYGVICPMVGSGREAAAFVGACRYPPLGFRSLGPNRAVQYAGADYWRHANSEVLLLAMVETAEGIDNLDDILAVEGLDGIYVGPGDLSLALGAEPSMAPSDRAVIDAVAEVLRRTRSKGLIAGVHTDGPATAARRFSEGFQLCTLQSDVRYLLNGSAAALAEVRRLTQTP